MRYSNYGNIINRMKRNITTAFDNAARRFGEPTDPDLQLYQSFEPEDLNKIAREFGERDVFDYIRRMEGRKLMGGRRGTIRFRPQ